MVDEFAFLEIGAEAAAGPRRYALRAQHGDMQQGEMAADADDPLAGRPCDRQRLLVLRRDGLEDLFDRTEVRLGMLLGAEREPIGGCDVFVHHQALNDRGEPADVMRQAVEQPRLAAGVAHGDRRAIGVENGHP